MSAANFSGGTEQAAHLWQNTWPHMVTIGLVGALVHALHVNAVWPAAEDCIELGAADAACTPDICLAAAFNAMSVDVSEAGPASAPSTAQNIQHVENLVFAASIPWPSPLPSVSALLGS